jgi:molybdopterin-containing oxidoreductase family iron-sulfur binding subunit|tara:strand:+ start:2029 stop:2772 length:744 start_codon:yes stop_codon:yes gene_type:complete
MKKYEIKLDRRSFMKNSAMLGLASIAPGVFFQELAYGRPLDEPASSKIRWGMLIDTNQCTEDCNACVTACDDEHGIEDFGRPATDTQWIRKMNLTDELSGKSHSLPMMCQHCENPPCVDVCPTGASFKRDDGIVLVNKHTCIGCRYCMMACPYKARSFVHENLENQVPHSPRGKGCVESCNLCVHKIDNGDNNTACAEACQKDGHQAILFGDLNDPQSDISKQLHKYGGKEVRGDLGLNTAVRYRGI